MARIELRITGAAKTAGSKRAFSLRRKDGSIVTRANGSAVVAITDDCVKGKAWRRSLQQQAALQWPRGLGCLPGPLRVSFSFMIARRKGHYRTGKFSHVLRDDAPGEHAVKPDVLKLARAVEDALTGLAWIDDAQIIGESLTKSWGATDELLIAIETVDF